MRELSHPRRAVQPLNWIDTLWQDLRFAARLLAQAPGFTVAAVACLAIGIGVAASMYSILESLVFRDLPAVSDPQGLWRFQTPMPYDNWTVLRDRGEQFSEIAAFLGPVPLVLGLPGGEPERLWGHLATPNYFSTLGVQPLAGRLFGAEEERGSPPVVVIGARLWRARFGGALSAVGRTVRINGQPAMVIGIAPENFAGASPMLAAADLWIPTTAPAALAPEIGRLHDRAEAFDLIGRLEPGVTADRAQTALEPLVRQLEQTYNDPGKDRKEPRVRLLRGGRLFPMRDEDMGRALGLPVVLYSLILLMACGNVATMLVARAAARRREIGVRLAMGASRGRLVRQLLTESFLLAAIGGTAGLLLARWVVSAYGSFGALVPGYIQMEFSMDWRALLFSAALTLTAGMAFGLAPALYATRGEIAPTLRTSAPPHLRAKRWFSLRNFLVAQQVAASVVLLLLTGFIVIGFGHPAEMGFDYRNLYLLSVDPVRDGLSAARAADYMDRLPRWLARVPGVSEVCVAQSLPGAFSGVESIVAAKAELAGSLKALGAIQSDRVGVNFFETAGIPILRGRGFEARDANSGTHVLVVNETMAKQVWPGMDALGQRLEFEGTPHEVIGVARDISSALPLKPPQPAVYRPVTPSAYAIPSQQGITIMVRVRPGFDAATRLRREISGFDRNVTVFNVRRMQDVVTQTFFLVRLAVTIYGAMGMFALILASVGLAGVTAYSVARRSHEIGIRLALGASRRGILGLVMRESAALVAVGGLAGLGVALIAMRLMNAMLETLAQVTRTSVSDVRLLVGAPALLAVLALLACYLPARRTMRIDPAASLRAE